MKNGSALVSKTSILNARTLMEIRKKVFLSTTTIVS
jgi:hypothetical protein